MTIANYDNLLDPPDPLHCDEHGQAQPCGECKLDAAEFRYECLKEDGRGW